MEKDKFIEFIGNQIIEKLEEIELEDDQMDIIDLMKHHADIRLVPLHDDSTEEEPLREVELLQNEIIEYVIRELQKDRKPLFLN